MINAPLATELTASPHETILEAARDLIAEGGIEAMSMRAVAERVGVSATALYHHYANKQALVDAVVRLAFERFGAEMQAAADRHPRGSLQRVRALGEAYARFALEHEASFRIIFSMAAPTLRDTDELPAGAGYPLLRETIVDAVASGEMRAGDPGFIVTTQSYFHFQDESGIRAKIRDILKKLNPDNSKQLLKAATQIKELISNSKMPQQIADEIKDAYERLEGLVAVRSSATAEALPEASFAGQQRTFLNILGKDEVVSAVQGCWASLFEPRAIFYREQHSLDHLKVGIAVVVQRMVQSEKSGVMFTKEPVTNEEKIAIEAVYGLGEWISRLSWILSAISCVKLSI